MPQVWDTELAKYDDRGISEVGGSSLQSVPNCNAALPCSGTWKSPKAAHVGSSLLFPILANESKRFSTAWKYKDRVSA